MDLAFEVDRLGGEPRVDVPGLGMGRARPAWGGRGAMPLSAAVDAMERLHDYE